MTQMRVPTSSLGSLALKRALSTAERRSFADRLLHWYIEELNALGDRIRFNEGRPDIGIEAAQPGEDARARAREILAALHWNREEVLTAVRGRLGQPIEMPEDAFGPGVILWSLDKGSAELGAWAMGLSEDAKQSLLAFDESMKTLWAHEPGGN